MYICRRYTESWVLYMYEMYVYKYVFSLSIKSPQNPPKIPLFIWMFLVGQNELSPPTKHYFMCQFRRNAQETERISSPVLRHEVQSPHKGQRSGFIS